LAFGFQDGPPETTRIGFPKGLWTDAENIYFLDNSLRRFNTTSREVTTVAGRALRLSGGSIPPQQFAATSITGAGGLMYATSGFAVYRISVATREVTHLAGAFNESGTRDGSAIDARFLYPSSLTLLGRDLFITNSGRVRRVNINTGQVTTLATALDTPRGLWASGNSRPLWAVPPQPQPPFFRSFQMA
jgi:hypothetical protein